MLKKLNLKDFECSKEDACALLEIEIEMAKKEKCSVLKIVHGYGSSGKGGVILKEIRNNLFYLKRTKNIKDYFSGNEWTLSCLKTQEILKKNKYIYNDEDLNKNNPGITVIII